MKLVNHYSMFDKWITGFPVILCMALPLSCSDSGMPLTDAPHEEICVLETDGSCGMLGRLNSLAVIDSDCFAICDEMQVYLYNMQGKQIRCIGRSGNAGYEYNMPTVVRTDGNDIYVWSSMTLKFLAYDLQGKVTGEYGYSSAVRDFIPCGDNIAVYTNGVRDDMMIDIYSKSDKEIQGCFWNTTEEHKVLLKWLSSAPLLYDNGNIYSVPQDKLELVRIDKTGKAASVSTIRSDSFSVSESRNTRNRQAAMKYRLDNPYTVLLAKKEGSFFLLTSEGIYSEKDKGMDDSRRYYTLYKFAGHDGKRLMSFSCRSFGYSNLLSEYDGDIYYIHHEIIDGEDVYTLNRLKY